MPTPIDIVNLVAKETNEVVLMHSAAGKDSIALLDMLSSKFERIVCTFMYAVKDLSFIDKYIAYQEKRYPNCEFVQVPHFMLLRMMRFGQLGIKPNPDIKLYNLAQLSEQVCKKYDIDWRIMGFKKSDSLNRRLMLNTYELGAINRDTKCAYPLSNLKNKDVLKYIELKKLIRPIKYDNAQSSDVDPRSGAWLEWCKKNYPDDYKKVIRQFPLAGAFLFEYEQKNNI